MYSFSNSKINFPNLKEITPYNHTGFTNYVQAIEALEVLNKHKDSPFENMVFSKEDDLNSVINKCVNKILNEFKAESIYYFTKLKTWRVFKPLNYDHKYAYHVLFIKPFFDNYDNLRRSTKTLILQFLKVWFSECFYNSETGLDDWVKDGIYGDFEFLDSNSQEYKELSIWFENYNKCSEKINSFKPKISLTNLLKSYKPISDFEIDLLKVLKYYDTIDISEYFEFFNYSNLSINYLYDRVTQSTIGYRNNDSFFSLYCIGYEVDDRFHNNYNQHVNDRYNYEVSFEDLYDYFDISTNEFGKFKKPNMDNFYELSEFISQFNNLLETLKNE